MNTDVRATHRYLTMAAVAFGSFALALALVQPATAQPSHFDALANLPFEENCPTAETAQALRDELLFFAILRLYAPTEAAIDKSWKPGDIVKTSETVGRR